jgi:hypothetical protein
MHLSRTSAHLLQALLRDGYRCAISGVYDLQSCRNIAEVDTASKAVPNTLLTQTEVAHIFSESAQDGDKVSTSLLDTTHPTDHSTGLCCNGLRNT